MAKYQMSDVNKYMTETSRHVITNKLHAAHVMAGMPCVYTNIVARCHVKVAGKWQEKWQA